MTKTIYFVIMKNVFFTAEEIHKRYDLKGSTYKRYTSDTFFIKIFDIVFLEINQLQEKT